MAPRSEYVQFVEDEDIYIDCRPVETYGGDVVLTDEDNNIENVGVSADVLDEISVNFSDGTIINNIGFQTLLGLILLAIIYCIGNYVFKQVPKMIINKNIK